MAASTLLISFTTLSLSPADEHVFFLSEKMLLAPVIVPVYTQKENFHCISTIFSNKAAYFNILWVLHMSVGSFFKVPLPIELEGNRDVL